MPGRLDTARHEPDSVDSDRGNSGAADIPPVDDGRRALLRRIAIGLSLAPLAAVAPPRAGAADLPLLAEGEPAAKAVGYVEDAKRAKDATPGAACSNCSIYSGAEGAATGTCSLFPGKRVRANGWCTSWSSL